MKGKRLKSKLPEMMVKRKGLGNAKGLHNGKAGAIHKSKVFVGITLENYPGSFLVGRLNTYNLQSFTCAHSLHKTDGNGMVGASA